MTPHLCAIRDTAPPKPLCALVTISSAVAGAGGEEQEVEIMGGCFIHHAVIIKAQTDFEKSPDPRNTGRGAACG